MALRDQFSLIRQGVPKWNKWRDENPATVIHLENADLQRANLRGANLRDAILRGADLQGAVLLRADLQGAVLQGANLRDANLRDADLQGAVLRGADLQRAKLRGANLRDAILRGADLQRADLRDAILLRADLQGAILLRADLQRADLRGANLRGVNGVTCEQLRESIFWETAYRDLPLACDEAIPVHSTTKSAAEDVKPAIADIQFQLNKVLERVVLLEASDGTSNNNSEPLPQIGHNNPPPEKSLETTGTAELEVINNAVNGLLETTELMLETAQKFAEQDVIAKPPTSAAVEKIRLDWRKYVDIFLENAAKHPVKLASGLGGTITAITNARPIIEAFFNALGLG